MCLVIPSMMELSDGHHALVWWNTDWRIAVASITWGELLLACISETLQWRLSATSLHSTICLKLRFKCPTGWELKLAIQAKSVMIVRPIWTTFVMNITDVWSTWTMLNEMGYSSNTLGSGDICHMVQQRNSVQEQNVATHRWNQIPGHGILRFNSSLSWQLRWFWPLQLLWWSRGATIVCWFRSPDQIHFTHYSADKTQWPVLVSLGNNDFMIRSKPPNLACILVAHLPVTVKSDFTGLGKTSTMKERQIQNRKAACKASKLICCFLDVLFNTGKLMLCADSQIRQGHPDICAWTADCMKNIHLH